MSYRLPAIAAAFLALLFSGCKKEDGPADPRPKYLTILTAGPWQISSYTIYKRVSDDKVDTLNVLKSIPECNADDIYTFQSPDGGPGGTFQRAEGLLLCDSTVPEPYAPQTWSIPYSTGSSLIIRDGNFGDIYTLESLTDSVLRISQAEQYDPRRNQVNRKLIIYRRVI